MLRHPMAMEGARLLPVIYPEGETAPGQFESIYRRGQGLFAGATEGERNVGLFLVGLAEAGQREGGTRHAA